MRYRTSCGIIPLHIDNTKTLRFLLVQGHGDFWGFPKGHKEKKETHLETAQRELLEETSIVCSKYFSHRTYKERYRIPKKRGSDIIKKVIYFVGLTENTHVKLQTTELKKYGWFTLSEARERLLDHRLEIIDQVYEFAREQKII